MVSLKKLLKPEGALFKLLRYKGIQIESGLINEELGKHPDSPSLLAICDVLTAFDVDNTVFRLDFDDLPELECPFLAYTNIDKGDLVAVTRYDGKNFYVSSDKWEKHRLSKDEFRELYTGIVLVIEASENFQASKNTERMRNYRLPAIVVALTLILTSALAFNSGYFHALSWATLLLTLAKTAGLVTVVLLLIQSIDNDNPLVQVICQSDGNTDCNSVLRSDAARIFSWLSWSEVGFFYFAGTWLALLFSGGNLLTWQVLMVLNVISLPYTFYSIYFQARVAKQWCVLCCTVQALLWVEFIPLLYAGTKLQFTFSAPAQAWSSLFISLLMPAVLWMMFKPTLLKAQQVLPLKRQLRQFKYNADLFNKLLSDQPKFDMPEEEWSLVLGNPEAKTVITMVTGPYCGPCADAHGDLEDFLNQNKNIQVRIVFKTGNIDTDITTPVSRHLMAMYLDKDKSKVQEAMHDWYGQGVKNYETWAKKYPVQFDESQFYKLDKHRDWIQTAGINATPTLLVNGRRLPDTYQLPDLRYMLN